MTRHFETFATAQKLLNFFSFDLHFQGKFINLSRNLVSFIYRFPSFLAHRANNYIYSLITLFSTLSTKYK